MIRVTVFHHLLASRNHFTSTSLFCFGPGVLRPSATELRHQGPQFGDTLGILIRQVLPLADILGQVEELNRGPVLLIDLQNEFPIPLANAISALAAMVDGVGRTGLSSPLRSGRKLKLSSAGVVGKLHAEEVGHRGHDIHLADQPAANGAGLAPRPANGR